MEELSDKELEKFQKMHDGWKDVVRAQKEWGEEIANAFIAAKNTPNAEDSGETSNG